MSWPFYHRNVSRLEAEELLQQDKEDGSFLIRDSESFPGAYALCIISEGRIHTYRILPDGNGKIFLEQARPEGRRKFVDLGQLIHECQHRGDKCQFACALKNPVVATTDPESDKDTDDEGDSESSSTESKEDYVTRIFLQTFATLDLSSFDEKFTNELRRYIESGINIDATTVTPSDGKLKLLQKLLSSAAVDVDRSLQVFMNKVAICEKLFGCHFDASKTTLDIKKNEELELTAVFEKMSSLKNRINNLEKTALKRLKSLQQSEPQDYDEISTYTDFSATKAATTISKTIIPASDFKVKLSGPVGKLSQRDVILTVDLQSGILRTVRPTKDVFDANNTFSHDRIAQLIKNTSNNCRLEVRFDDGKKKDIYTFEDAGQRERFCQLVQQMKNMQSTSQSVDGVSIYIGTWNMGNAVPHDNLSAWFQCQGKGKSRDPSLSMIPHDLYVIGTQESSLSDKEWINRVKNTICSIPLLTDLYLVSVTSMWDMRIVVFVKPEYKNKISHIQTSSVGTGIANTLGNKGAVGVSFYFDGTAFCFVNSHLASGHEHTRWKRRNQNFRDIIRGLSLSNKQMQSTFDLTNQFHHLFWFGDLNYRLEMSQIQEILQCIKEDNLIPLLEKDQLSLTKDRKDAFYNFCEEDITFPPTYRFEKGSQTVYAWEKFKKSGVRINVPSWCDRVLWKCYPEAYISCTSYGSVPGISTSDHKPLFATFSVGIATQYVSSTMSSKDNGSVKISFESVSAEIMTRSKQKFFLEIYSTCLNGSITSLQNDQFEKDSNTHCRPYWSPKCIPKLTPIIGDVDYLADQHLLIAVKACDGVESYGECVLALKTMFSTVPQSFECPLTHGGEATGWLRGYMNVKSDDPEHDALSRKRLKSYELIYTDTQFLRQNFADSHKSSPAHLDVASCSQNLPNSVPNPKKQKPEKNMDIKNQITDTTPSPQIPPRRTRLGQSSLNQASVLPVVSPTKAFVNHTAPPEPSGVKLNIPTTQTAGLTVPIPCHTTKPAPVSPATVGGLMSPPAIPPHSSRPLPDPHAMTPPPVPPHRPKLAAPIPEKQEFQRTNSKREGMIAKSAVHCAEDYSDVGFTAPAWQATESATRGSKQTTQSPAKFSVVKNEETTYAGLTRPQTVNQWLLGLGLPQYTDAFLIDGWDQMAFVDDITDEALVRMKIFSKQHRRRILESVADFRCWSSEEK